MRRGGKSGELLRSQGWGINLVIDSKMLRYAENE